MKDNYGREINYMRISVTELCNLRCRYCMPEDGICKKAHESMLTEDEMITAVEAAASLGITKLRITGGEPKASEEAEDVRWVTPEEAAELVTHPLFVKRLADIDRKSTRLNSSHAT